jgi:hypothetical protein
MTALACAMLEAAFSIGSQAQKSERRMIRSPVIARRV